MITITMRLYRLQKNFSQEYMAFRLGISQKAYSKIEAGVTKLTVERLSEIATILEINIVCLIESTTISSNNELPEFQQPISQPY
jgi:transcriptional regulator with XRE-family HTH domain